MEWLQQFNLALDYIEEHLAGDLSYDKAAQIACCSTPQFQRMFSYIAGISLSEYIRRRRMSAAALDLIDQKGKILEIAARYGYRSPTAFNRAFQSVHGVPPSAVWTHSTECAHSTEGTHSTEYAHSAASQPKPFLTTCPRLRFQISVTGEEEIKYKIEVRGPFRAIGVKMPLQASIEENFTRVPVFWQQTRNSPVYPRLLDLMNQEPRGLLGITAAQGGQYYEHIIGVASSRPLPEGLEECIVPEQTWVIFQCVGPAKETCQKTYRKFYTQWLPISDYAYHEGFDIEVYPPGDPTSPAYHFECWLPVVKKGKHTP